MGLKLLWKYILELNSLVGSRQKRDLSTFHFISYQLTILCHIATGLFGLFIMSVQCFWEVPEIWWPSTTCPMVSLGNIESNAVRTTTKDISRMLFTSTSNINFSFQIGFRVFRRIRVFILHIFFPRCVW